MKDSSRIDREAAKELAGQWDFEVQEQDIDVIYDELECLEELGFPDVSRLFLSGEGNLAKLKHILEEFQERQDPIAAINFGLLNYREEQFPEHFGNYELPNKILSKIDEAYEDSAEGTFVILDLGCGRGDYHEEMIEFSESLGERDVELIGIDYIKSYLKTNDVAETVLTDLREAFTIKDDSVDFIYSNFLKYNIISKGHDEDWENLKREADRALKNEGLQYHSFRYL